jgi:putative endonuclease
MYYVYLIKSKKVDNWVYTGSTNDLKKRLALHNGGHVVSTKNHRPYELVYYESYLSEKDARKREKTLKMRANSLRQLKRRLTESLKAY